MGDVERISVRVSSGSRRWRMRVEPTTSMKRIVTCFSVSTAYR